jgi:2-phosphosulfolactate phosphatase
MVCVCSELAIAVIVTRHTRITSRLVRVHVAFTPSETTPVPTAIVVDVLRATSTIAEAFALREELGDAVLAGERGGNPPPGFDLGNSPIEFLRPRAEAVVLTTSNGTRAIVQAAANCKVVLVGSLLNLEAVAAAARRLEEDVEIVCAGLRGGYSEDDAYCAGRLAALVGGEATDAAERALELAASFPSAEEALRSIRRVGETVAQEDLAWCARENAAPVVPQLASMHGSAAEIVGA